MKTEELIKAKKYIEHVIGTIRHDGHLGTIKTDWIFPDLEKALAAIGEYECSSDTDKLSVEKLQEHLLPYKKETVQKIIDEKMQLVTADEFLKLHKESLTAIRENDKLQEQLNTAKKALTEIAEILNDKIHKCDYSCDNFCEFDGRLNMYSVENVQSVIDSSLAEIGGIDDNY